MKKFFASTGSEAKANRKELVKSFVSRNFDKKQFELAPEDAEWVTFIGIGLPLDMDEFPRVCGAVSMC